MPALEEGRDLDRYLRASKKVDLGDLEWDRIKDDPVTVEEARCLSAGAVDRLRDDLIDMLTALEQEVLRLYIGGRSYRNMAESLGSSLKSIDNALQRVKRKL